MRSTSAGTLNPLTAMRKLTTVPLLLLGGCATAAGPHPAAVPAWPETVVVQPAQADSGKSGYRIVEIHEGACETNDRMAAGTFRAAPRGHRGTMPGTRMSTGSVPMPNACPVTVPPTGQVFYHAVPAGGVRIRVLKSPPGTKPEN